MLAAFAVLLAAAPLAAPELEGGSVIRVSPRGTLEVRDAGEGRLRWKVGLGGPADHVAADARRVYVSSGPRLRAFAGGVARWSLDLGAPAERMELHPGALLRVRLPGGTVWVDGRRGRFCTPRAPCQGLGAPALRGLGLPWLDLAGLGVPGLGLLVNPELLARGDALGAWVAPGWAPGFAPAPPAPPAPPIPRAREVDGGAPRVEVGRGRSGKVRSLGAGTARPLNAAPEVAPAPDSE